MNPQWLWPNAADRPGLPGIASIRGRLSGKEGRTQPAVSLALKSLEDDLGLKLFERRGRRLSPAPEAQYLLSEATGVLDRLAQVSRAMQSMRTAETGRLSLAAMPGVATVLFPKFVSSVLARSPDVSVSLLTRSSTQIRKLGRSHAIDFAFSDFDRALEASPQISETVITGDSFLAVHRDHPLAAKAKVGLDALHQAALCRMQADSPFDRSLDQRLVAEGVTPRQIVRSQIMIPVIQFVAAGQGAAIFDPLTVASEQTLNAGEGKIAYVKLADPLRYEYTILTPRFRPLSEIAKTVRNDWREEVLRLLHDVGARPEVDAFSEDA